LEELILEDNKGENLGAAIISEALENNSSLKYLNLRLFK